jgi:SHS2 domain-containing protein
MARSFRFLDDIALADIAFEAEGDSVEELFSAATEALCEAMADPATVGMSWERTIELRDADVAALFFDWLSHLVYLKDAEAVVFRTATFTCDKSNDVWVLRALLVGAPVDPQVQELRNDVKGVTKHLYAVTEQDGRWKARVVLDV